MTRRPAPAHIPSLTGFRGYAALIVLLNHAGQFSGLQDFLFVRFGYFGVPCFFCLSGALFALLYFEEATTRPAFLGRYYAARFIRIFPVYWLVLAVYALTVSPVDWAATGWHVVMGHGFLDEYRNAINVPMWTLPVECGFYLLAPWVFVLMRKLQERSASPGTAQRSWQWMHAASLLAFSLVLWGAGAGLHALVPDDLEWWKGTIFGRFSQFGLGVATGLLLADVRSGVIRLPRSAGDWFTLAAISLFLVQTMVLTVIEVPAMRDGPQWLFYAVKLSLAVTACLLILAAVCDSHWQRLLSSRPMLYFGAISYALYLIQCASFGPVLNLSETMAHHFVGRGYNAWVSAGLTMLVCLAVAALVHHTFESPVQQWLRRSLLRRPTT